MRGEASPQTASGSVGGLMWRPMEADLLLAIPFDMCSWTYTLDMGISCQVQIPKMPILAVLVRVL